VRRQATTPRAGFAWSAVAAAISLLILLLAASSASASVGYVETIQAGEVQKHSAELHGVYISDKEAHYYYEWGETDTYGQTTPLPPGIAGDAGFHELPPVQISGLSAGTTYHFRLVVSDADGVVRGNDMTFTTVPALDNAKADPPTAVTDVSAELNGSFDSVGEYEGETFYYFEWGQSAAYGKITPALPGASVPVPSGRVQVPSVSIAGLERGVTYHYRLVVTNPAGKSISPDSTFRTADAPVVSNVHSSGVTATQAVLEGDIIPRWGSTTYQFEWGPTPEYGNTVPVPAGEVGSGDERVSVAVPLSGLDPAITYHFRLVATNEFGMTVSPDQAFGFFPPPCPNSQVRQETRANHLPDCRGYELVSPSFAQGAVVMAASGPTSGQATNPARIAYAVDFGLFDESTGEAMNSISDLFVSTRSDDGWGQRYIGIPATQGIFMGGPLAAIVFSPSVTTSPGEVQRGTQATPSLDRILNYNWSYPGQGSWKSVGSNGPYVWNSTSGSLLERWPTNLAQVPDGEHFAGFPQASPDFNHFVFSSNVVFAEGGEAGGGEIKCCLSPEPVNDVWPRESVYDNDVRTGSVVLASVREDGTPFKGRAFDISVDGSHILMTEEATLQGTTGAPLEAKEAIVGAQIEGPLYLRVNAERTYEIAAGHQIEYAGSTADGSTVYLASEEQLTPDDTDSSRDLFVWHEDDPDSLTRVSTGSAGNSDACAPNEGWTTDCGISIIDFDAPRNPAGLGGNGHSDSYLASRSGDIYFESPEQLVGQKGQPDERNLYLYREGSLRYVATMKPSRRISRMQVTSNGRYTALSTGSNLTDYDSAGYLEMYLYNSDEGRLTCVSCRPDSQPPVSDVLASQNGLFLADDGRPFFSTSDSLAPRDTNKSEDVYEFTEGKPQLITTGIGSGLEVYIGGQTAPGLISVSANGTDVYFATTDRLVTQDHNGAQIKIYDARTGGGFPAEREVAKCAAADECHGAGTPPPALPADRTSASLGTSGKAKARKGKTRKKHKRKHRKRAGGKTKAKTGSHGKQGGKRHG
jgi:hypothetical protein